MFKIVLITINFDFITKTFTYLGKADRNTRLKDHPSNHEGRLRSMKSKYCVAAASDRRDEMTLVFWGVVS